MSEIASGMIELDAKSLGLLFLLAISVATNIVAVWMLRHNIPELHAKHLETLTAIHKLDKSKLTRPEIQAMGPRPGEWPKVEPKTADDIVVGEKGTGT